MSPAAPSARAGSRHVDRHMVSFPGDVYDQLTILADRNDRPISREARRIMIEALTKAGLWPPPDPPPG